MEKIAGWVFLIAGILFSESGGEAAVSMTLIILAKLCWIHQSVKEQR